jgi:hypothetical protein
MKRFIAIALLLVACGGSAGGGQARFKMPSVDASTGVQVLVTIGPTCPVETPGKACDDKPYETDVIIVERPSRTVIGSFHSDVDGQFGVSGMKPGEYTILPASTTGPPTAQPVDFTVKKGSITKVTISFDSGIR